MPTGYEVGEVLSVEIDLNLSSGEVQAEQEVFIVAIVALNAA
jgi:hypothetical protein